MENFPFSYQQRHLSYPSPLISSSERNKTHSMALGPSNMSSSNPFLSAFTCIDGIQAVISASSPA